MRSLVAEPIDPARYARYGQVVSARDDESARSANHGTALAWDALAEIVNLRGDAARAKAALFRCRAFHEATLDVRLLERHPGSTQMFAPMRASRYLVVVALGGDEPDLSTLAAFVVEGPQAITYAPGVWHHPMVALDSEADFVNLLFSDGTAGDCDERSFGAPVAQIAIPPRHIARPDWLDVLIGRELRGLFEIVAHFDSGDMITGDLVIETDDGCFQIIGVQQERSVIRLSSRDDVVFVGEWGDRKGATLRPLSITPLPFRMGAIHYVQAEDNLWIEGAIGAVILGDGDSRFAVRLVLDEVMIETPTTLWSFVGRAATHGGKMSIHGDPRAGRLRPPPKDPRDEA